MRRTFGIALLGCLSALPTLAQPKDPLLKPVVPPAGQVRVRLPLEEGEKQAIRSKAQVPNPKKKGEYIESSAAIDSLNKSMLTSKMLEKWGYKPAGNSVVIPEVLLAGHQLGSKAAKSDLFFRVQNVKFEVLETAPDGGEQMFGADMLLNLQDVQKSAHRTHETRFHFPDRFLDLTVPPTAVKRPGLGDDPPPEPKPSDEPKLVAVACPMTFTPGFSFTGASINGVSSFVNPNGRMQGISPMFASATYGGNGIIMNIGMARALKLDVDLTKEPVKGSSTDKRLRLVEYTLKEMRFGTLTGPGLNQPGELVFTDVQVWVEVTESEPGLWIGYPFLAKHFKDGVLAYTSDGKAAMHGRVQAELLAMKKK